MKTTIELADDLARKAKALATRRGTTLRAVIEDGIRLSLEREAKAKRYRLPDKSVGGKGLRDDFEGKPWSSIREAAYEERRD